MNFTISELCASSKAKQLGIDNTPKDLKVYDNMLLLITECLQPLRDAWSNSIYISSGFRCPELNSAVNGSKSSSHVEGCACDLYVKGDMDKFFKFARNYFKYNPVDQLIKEKVGNSTWLHIGYRKDNNRNMFLTTTDGRTYKTWNE